MSSQTLTSINDQPPSDWVHPGKGFTIDDIKGSRREHGYAYIARGSRVQPIITVAPLSLTAAQKDKFDCTFPITDPLKLYELVGRAVLTTDELCSFIRSGHALETERKNIHALKNMMLRSLWRERRDLFIGTWEHTTVIPEVICRECVGKGNFGFTIDGTIYCRRCKGTGKQRTEEQKAMSVFAIQTVEYSTTWHFPRATTHALLGSIEYGRDLINSGRWHHFDQAKSARTFTHDEVEEKRSFMAWFLNRFLEEAQERVLLLPHDDTH